MESEKCLVYSNIVNITTATSVKQNNTIIFNNINDSTTALIHTTKIEDELESLTAVVVYSGRNIHFFFSWSFYIDQTMRTAIHLNIFELIINHIFYNVNNISKPNKYLCYYLLINNKVAKVSCLRFYRI